MSSQNPLDGTSPENNTPQWSAPNAPDVPPAPPVPPTPAQDVAQGPAVQTTPLPGYPAAPSTPGYPAAQPTPSYPGQPAASQVPPAQPPAGYGQPQSMGYAGAGASYGATSSAYSPFQAATPGIIPLRALTISDLFDGTFKAIRSNPGPMFGFTIAISALSGVLAALVTFLVTPDNLQQDMFITEGQIDSLDSMTATLSGLLYSSVAQALVQGISVLILSGMLALVVSEAVIGRKMDVSTAWARVKGSIWRLVGYSLLLQLMIGVIVAVVGLFVYALFEAGAAEDFGLALMLLIVLVSMAAVLLPYFYLLLRFLYGPTIIVLENQPVMAAFKRSWKLTSGVFWQTFGRYVVMTMLISVAAGFAGGFVGIFQGLFMIMFPFSVANALSTFLTAVVTGLFIPISSAYVVLMYIDRRIRTEGLADSLMKAAQR